jgi:uncharacterized protein (TIGR02246 family)
MTGDQARDCEAIRQCLAACSQAGDARKADTYAACFATDGLLELGDAKTGAIIGREAIRAWMTAPSVIPQPADGTPGYVSHHLTTCHIDFTGPDTAMARTYWLVTSAAGLDHNGYYVDRLVRENGAWRIAHRRIKTLWTNPASVLHAGG